MCDKEVRQVQLWEPLRFSLECTALSVCSLTLAHCCRNFLSLHVFWAGFAFKFGQVTRRIWEECCPLVLRVVRFLLQEADGMSAGPVELGSAAGTVSLEDERYWIWKQLYTNHLSNDIENEVEASRSHWYILWFCFFYPLILNTFESSSTPPVSTVLWGPLRASNLCRWAHQSFVVSNWAKHLQSIVQVTAALGFEKNFGSFSSFSG